MSFPRIDPKQNVGCCAVMMLVLAIMASLVLTSCDSGDVVVKPSGCIQIKPPYSKGEAEPSGWVHYPAGNEQWPDATAIYDVIPEPNVFIGYQAIRYLSYIWNAPEGANRLARAYNCMTSDGGSQG